MYSNCSFRAALRETAFPSSEVKLMLASSLQGFGESLNFLDLVKLGALKHHFEPLRSKEGAMTPVSSVSQQAAIFLLAEDV